MDRRTLLKAGAALGAGAPGLRLSAQPQAQTPAYPTRPIRLIVPFATGGTTDFTARTVAQKLSKVIGQPVVVENKGGAAGTIGADIVAKSAPDGYTLMMADTTFAIVPGVASKLPYDPLKDFAPVALAIKVPSLVLVNPKLPIHSLKELLDYARSNPGKVAYGSGGVGSPVHLAGALLATRAGADMTHVPYKGAGPAIADVVAGQIQLVIPSMPTVVSFVNAGQLRALAITASKRSDQLPDVPTATEAGLSDYDATSWFGFSAPAGTPRAIIDQLNQAINETLADKDVRESFIKQGADISTGSPAAFAAFIENEMTKWAAVAKASNVTADLR